MNRILRYLILLVSMMVLIGCNADYDFSDLVNDNMSNTNFQGASDTSFVYGNDGLIIINGVDSCFVQFIDGKDNVEINSMYIGGDMCYYDGITSYLRIHPLRVGTARCRLYNHRLNYDSQFKINILPRYTTYNELSLDFDDTKDSLIEKINTMHYFGLPENKYVVDDPNNDYELQITYNDNGLIDHYVVNFLSDNINRYLGSRNNVCSTELKGFLEERYQKSNNSDVYYRSDSTGVVEVAILLDEEKLTLTYKDK